MNLAKVAAMLQATMASAMNIINAPMFSSTSAVRLRMLASWIVARCQARLIVFRVGEFW